MEKKASIIIRTKNEEKWIGACLRSVYEQDYKNYEVIIVDDNSTDGTLEIVKEFPVRLIEYKKEYLPGLSLNTGIKESSGDIIVCLSGHCVPVDTKWLKNLIRNFKSDKVAAVYGRQEPLPYSSDRDKRDLWTIFGLDRKVQSKDSFFHNANSALLKDLWKKIPFDESTTNIEDRIWAKSIIKEGYQIIYDPEASVYHWHGIHQDGNAERLKNVVKIVETLELIGSNENKFEPDGKLNITAIIPKKGESLKVNGRSLISYTIERALESKLINDVIVATDSQNTANEAKRLGAQVPFIRPKELSYEYVGLNKVMSYTLSQLKILKQFPDLVVILQETHPFRTKNFLDSIIKEYLYKGFDTIIPISKNYNLFFKKEEEGIISVDKGLIPQKFKEPLYAGIVGLGMLIKPHFLAEEMLTGNNVGVFSINHKLSTIEMQNEKDITYFGKLLERFWENDE